MLFSFLLFSLGLRLEVWILAIKTPSLRVEARKRLKRGRSLPRLLACCSSVVPGWSWSSWTSQTFLLTSLACNSNSPPDIKPFHCHRAFCLELSGSRLFTNKTQKRKRATYRQSIEKKHSVNSGQTLLPGPPWKSSQHPQSKATASASSDRRRVILWVALGHRHRPWP